MRLILIVLGGLFAVAAGGIAVNLVLNIFSGDSPDSAGGFIFVVGTFLLPLSAMAAGLFYIANRLERREHRQRLAEARDHVSSGAPVLECPQCRDTNLVRGPARLRWYLVRWAYVARCLTCGLRCPCPAEVWTRLPASVLGDAYETIDDKWDHMARDPMTRGQLVLSLTGILVGFIAMMLLSPISGHLGFLVMLVPIGVGWWLGRWLFPPPREPGNRCVKCGYDLRWQTEPRCPECNTPFDPDSVTSMTREAAHKLPNRDEHDADQSGT